jgi:hypothetical protein
MTAIEAIVGLDLQLGARTYVMYGPCAAATPSMFVCGSAERFLDMGLRYTIYSVLQCVSLFVWGIRGKWGQRGWIGPRVQGSR